MKIWRANPVTENSDLPAGTLVKKDKESIYVQTGEGMLQILEIQMEGKKRMSVKDFMLGHSFETGIRFEREKR
jgi:methionyl-tRNA formyltransferase